MRLNCYPTSEERPIIRPAPVTRDWMDELPMEFGYRCIPLNIANAHGWEILCMAAFEVRWNGGGAADAVEIKSLEPCSFLPVSHFGSGIITFHTGYLFETEPGYNLWLSGPANCRKHGITPLTGIVETDWSPYNFTMNWALTAPDVTVRFEAGELFCSFFPVKRGLLETFEPEIRPFESVPDLQNHYNAWRQSRGDFLTDLSKPGTEANDERWQKNYCRGFTPDGAETSADHQIKLRLKPFKDGTGDSGE